MTRRKEPLVEIAEDGAGVAPSVEPVAAPEPLPGPAITESAPIERRRSGVIGPVLGGALALAAGFGTSHFNLLGWGPVDQTAAIAALTTKQDEALAKLAGSVEALTGRVTGLESASVPVAADPAALEDVQRRLGVIEAMPTGGEASTAALTAKMAELEAKLAGLPATGVDQAEVNAALARLAQAEAAATAAAKVAVQEKALEALRAAVASGGAFGAELEAVADPTLTAALGPLAAGVATVEALQAELPDAARAALAVARATAPKAGWTARLGDFLAAQTGARSLTPREGTDPDAVLSRAEFALAEGRLADALAEIAGLDATVKAPLDGWVAKAAARAAADAALAGVN